MCVRISVCVCWSRVEYPESRLVVLVVLGVRTDSIYGFCRTNPSIHYIDYRTRVQPGEGGAVYNKGILTIKGALWREYLWGRGNNISGVNEYLR